MPWLVLGVIFAGIALGISWLRHLVRRLRGAYRRGYALVAADAEVGAEIRPEHAFQMTSSPVFLPPGAGLLPVAIVRNAEGVRASFRDQGLVWTATSARIEQLLPSWTGFGPNGYLVLDVVKGAAAVPLERVETATAPAVSNKDLVNEEPQRSWLLNSIGHLTDWIVYNRLRDDVLGNPPREIADEDLEDEIQRRQGPGWFATRRNATVAGLAASEIETLQDRHLVAWTRPWVDLTKPQDWIHPTTPLRTRAVWKLGAVPDFIGRWPTLSAVLTFVMILVFFSIDVLVGLVASALGIGGLALAIGRRPARPGRWRPDATTVDRQVSPDRLRRALAGFRRTSHPLYQVWLHHVLPRMHVWVAVDAVKPAQPDRWLAWLDGNREVVPLLTFGMPDGRRAGLAFTTPSEHKPVERSLHIHWTLQLDWDRTMQAVRAAGCSALLIDNGRPWGIELTVREGDPRGTEDAPTDHLPHGAAVDSA
jgi:hypothetical protein